MDKASDYGSGDSRFESWQGHFFSCLYSMLKIIAYSHYMHDLHIIYSFRCNTLNNAQSTKQGVDKKKTMKDKEWR